MDSKKTYKKLITFFWVLVASMPLWLSVIQFVGSYLLHTDSLSYSDITSYTSSIQFNSYLNSNCLIFEDYTPTFLNDMWFNLFNTIDTNLVTTNIYICFSWFTWVFMLLILIDIAVWLPKLFHHWLGRWD